MENSLLMLNTSTKSFLIDINTIVVKEASSNYSKIYFSNGSLLLTAKVLKWFEDRLPHQRNQVTQLFFRDTKFINEKK